MAYAIRPSAAWIWGIGGCRGYAAMCAKYPEVPGVVNDTIREEGIAGHWVGHMMGQGYIVPEGSMAPNKVEVDSDMLEGAEMFLQELRYTGLPVYQEVTLPAVYIHKECGGTSDAWAWDAIKRKLYVWDYKYGYRFVDAFENPQLSIYVRSILDYLVSVGLLAHDFDDRQIEVEMVVVQPRSFSADPVRRWNCTAADLRGLWNLLKHAAIEVMSADPVLKAGDHCNDCPARHACPAAQRTTEVGIDLSAKMVPHDLTPTAMGDMLRRVQKAKEFLDSMEKGLEAQLLHAIANGHVDPHWTHGHGRSSTVIKEGREALVASLCAMYKVDPYKPPKMKTALQIQALIDPTLLAPHIETRPGRRKLVPFTARTVRKLLS